MKCKKCGFETETELGKFCPNCGEKFPSADEAASPTSTAASTSSTPKTDAASGPVGIWGWNTIPMLNLLWLAALCLFVSARDDLPLFFNGTMCALLTKECEAYNPILCVFIAIEVACLITLGILCIYVLVLAKRRSSSYPRLATILFWVYAIWGLVDSTVANQINPEDCSVDIIEITRGFVFAAIWTSYFMQSVRIKNTFVSIPAKWRRIRNVIGCVLGATLIVCLLGMEVNNPFEDEETESFITTDATEDVDDYDIPPIGVEYYNGESSGYIKVINKDPSQGLDVRLELGSEKSYHRVIPPGGEVEFDDGYWGDGSFGRLSVSGYTYVLTVHVKGGHYYTQYVPKEIEYADDEDRAPISATLDAYDNLTVTNKDPNRGYDIFLELGAERRCETIPPGGQVVFSDFEWHDGTIGKLSVPEYNSYLVVYSKGSKYETWFEVKED